MVVSPTHSRMELDEFLNWLTSSNATVSPNIIINPQTPTNRCLHATTTIPSNTTIITIPPSLTLTTTAALNHPHITEILCKHPPPHPTSTPSAALLLHLLLSQDTLSTWLQTIPNIITPTTAPSINSLHGTPLHPLAEALRTELHTLYDTWYLPITNSSQQLFPTTKQAFLRAYAIIETRAFDINNTTLSPLIDFCNHSTLPNARIKTEPDGAIHLLTTRTINAHEEITISYGELSNQDLLLHWGFALPNNPYDELYLSLDPPDDLARGLIYGLCVGETEFSLSRDEPLPGVLVKAARVLSLGEEEVVSGVKREYGEAVGVENEQRAIGVLTEVVGGLRCGVGEEEGDGGEFEQFCDVYRRGLEDILDSAVARIQAMERALEKDG